MARRTSERAAAAAPAPAVTVVLPAFDEAASVASAAREIASALAGTPHEILVVDDGSRDGTRTTAEAAGIPGLRVVAHARNRGYGAAVKTGVRAARGEVVLLADADGQHRGADAAAVLAALAGADMVVGARGAGSAGGALRRPGRWLLARVAAFLAREKVPDLTSGLRAFRREVAVRYLHLLPDGYSASTTLTLTLLARGYSVRYVPITAGPDSGSSQLRPLADGARALLLLVRLIVLLAPLRFFLPVSLGLIGLGVAYIIERLVRIKQGVPVGGLLLVTTGVIAFFFGLLADQIAELRKERFEGDGTPDSG
ncbi:MAG: glycosyltransferase family 2 protein [Planctomycetales bacterium]|nr:glycosyltransferase family 2 protein [Planctomycetales bacterium]